MVLWIILPRAKVIFSGYKVATEVSDPLMSIVRESPGFSRYQRTYHVAGGTRSHYLWVEHIPEYGVTSVTMRDRSEVIGAWLQSLLIPFFIWLVALVALYYGYRRAIKLLDIADADLRNLNTELKPAVQQLVVQGCHYFQGYLIHRPASVDELV